MKPLILYSCLLLILTTVTYQLLYDAENCGRLDVDEARSRRSIRRRAPFKYAKIDDSSKVVGEDEDGYYYSTDYEDDAAEERYGNDPMTRLVMGGKKVSVGELPWTALIHIYNGTADDETAYEVTCSGTLVTKRHIMTAAHCFRKEGVDTCSLNDMESVETVVKFAEVMVGGVCQEVDKKEGCTKEDIGTIMKVKKAYYEDYYRKACADTNDIAFIELEEDIPDDINHICLPHLHNIDDLDIFSSKYFAAGWGANPRKKQESTPRLHRIALGKRITNKECLKEVPDKKKDTFCTRDTPDKNVCKGDSGGGIITTHKGRHYLLGLLSYGTTCKDLLDGQDPSAEVHTDTGFFTAEIDSMLKMKVADHRKSWEKISEKNELSRFQFEVSNSTDHAVTTSPNLVFINVSLLLYSILY